MTGCNEAVDNFSDNNVIDSGNNLSSEKQANYYANLIINSYSNKTRSLGELEQNYHPSYGGSYINHNGKLVVMIANKDVEYKKYIQNLVGSQNVIFKFCENSYNSLLNVLDSLNNYKFYTCKNSNYSNFRHFGVRMLQNRIEVYLDDFSDNKIEEFKNQIHNAQVITFSKSEGDFILQSSLNPGEAVNNQINEGSIGYRARDAQGNVGIVVSGHLIKKGETLYQNQTPVGYCDDKSMRFYDIDAAFVETFDNYIPTNNIGGSYGILSTTITVPQVGTSITKYGKSTKATVGKILDTSDTFDLRSDGGPIHTDFVKADYTASSGDSGGIVFTTFGKQTSGIHVGVNGAGYTYYCKASNINKQFGLTRY